MRKFTNSLKYRTFKFTAQHRVRHHSSDALPNQQVHSMVRLCSGILGLHPWLCYTYIWYIMEIKWKKKMICLHTTCT